MMAAGGLKQRLVGALVLFCAGVVLWSLLFTGPQVRQIDRESQIPAAPEKVQINVPEPEPRNVEPVNTDLASKPKFDLPAAEARSADLTDESQPEKAVPETPALPAAATQHQDARGLPVSWVVVVGSFSDAAKAEGIRKDLQKRKYKVFTETLTRDGRTLYRVSIGPKLQKSQAEKVKQEVDALLKVTSSVRQFQSIR
jgi:DedD protein